MNTKYSIHSMQSIVFQVFANANTFQEIANAISFQDCEAIISFCEADTKTSPSPAATKSHLFTIHYLSFSGCRGAIPYKLTAN